MQSIKIFFNILISIFITIFSVNLFFNNEKNNINFSDLIHILKDGWIYLLLACILLIVSVFLRTYRWIYLFKSESRINFFLLFKSQLIGYFSNNVFPIRIGDVVRSYAVSKHTDKETSYIIGTIAMERVVDTLAIITLSIITLFYYGADYLEIQFNFINIPFLVIVLFIIILGFILYNNILKFSFSKKIDKILQNIWTGFSDIQLNHKKSIFMLSISIWLIFAINVYLIQLIYPDLKLNFFDCILILVASSFIQMIPVGFGAVGVFHLGVQGVLLKLGINNYNNFIIMLHLYSLFIYTFLGAYYFFTDNKLRFKNLFESINKT